jgi:hypothetical protein
MKQEEKKALAEPEEVGAKLVGPSQRMVYLGPDQRLACRTCGTSVKHGWACGEKTCTAFWYCPTCDEFLEWCGSGLTDQMTQESQASMRSFFKYIINRSQKGEGNNGRHGAGTSDAIERVPGSFRPAGKNVASKEEA